MRGKKFLKNLVNFFKKKKKPVRNPIKIIKKKKKHLKLEKKQVEFYAEIN